jgi:hypothetical protein
MIPLDKGALIVKTLKVSYTFPSNSFIKYISQGNFSFFVFGSLEFKNDEEGEE